MPAKAPLRLRDTDLTLEQRCALAQARLLLQPHFAGEQLRLYVPRQAVEQKLAREARIRQQLLEQREPVQIARQEGVTPQYVRVLRARLTAKRFPPE